MREKPLVSKLDSLWKLHWSRRKATTSFGKVKACKYYFLSNNMHVRNGKKNSCLGKSRDIVVQQVVQDTI